MANHTHHPRPRSAGIPGYLTRRSSTGYHRHEGFERSPDPLSGNTEHNNTSRSFFTSRLWRRRRYSDSASQPPPYPLTVPGSWQGGRTHRANSHNGRELFNCPLPPQRRREQQREKQQQSGRGRAPRPPKLVISLPPIDLALPSAVQHHSASPIMERGRSPLLSPSSSATALHQQVTIVHTNIPTTPTAPSAPGFLHIAGYTAHTIRARRPTRLRTRRDDVADALAHVHIDAGPVSLRGLDGLARSRGGGLLLSGGGGLLDLGGCGSGGVSDARRARLARSLGDRSKPWNFDGG
ncbi:hypothetical protein VTH82DRAFT_1493 [Thermothelomyces myriococcoides]